MGQRAADISSGSATSVDRLSFETFYRQRARSIGSALEVTLGDRELAEDALNEAMARALQRWKRVADFDNPEGWVYRVGLNWALSWLRRRRREREGPLLVPATAAEVPVADDQLRAAIDGLSVEHRSVVVCRYLFDWSVAQTAQSLEIPQGTVKSRLARALDHIRSAMEEHDEY